MHRQMWRLKSIMLEIFSSRNLFRCDRVILYCEVESTPFRTTAKLIYKRWGIFIRKDHVLIIFKRFLWLWNKKILASNKNVFIFLSAFSPWLFYISSCLSLSVFPLSFTLHCSPAFLLRCLLRNLRIWCLFAVSLHNLTKPTSCSYPALLSILRVINSFITNAKWLQNVWITISTYSVISALLGLPSRAPYQRFINVLSLFLVIGLLQFINSWIHSKSCGKFSLPSILQWKWKKVTPKLYLGFYPLGYQCLDTIGGLDRRCKPIIKIATSAIVLK